MKRLKLKGYVVPFLGVFLLAVIGVGIINYTKSLSDTQVASDESYNYTMSVFEETEVDSEETVTSSVSKPFTNTNVSIAKTYYSKDETEENQENALIYYENTYMPNTGILYESDEAFEVYATMSGEVIDIKTDEILGTVLTLENSSKVKTIYYGLGETKVNVGDTVNQNQIIGMSGTTKLITNKAQVLLFEVYIDGNTVNPETYYTMTLEELN